MNFVYPLLLGGLIFAGLPVLLHFLARQKPKTLPFPAFRFLMQKRRQSTRKLRLRQLLLLLLRMTLIALLCFALARPRLFYEQLGLSRERPVAMILIFDTSPSMDYKSGDMSRLDLAKKRGLELLEQVPDDCRVLILDSAEANRGEDWLKSLEKARQRIQGLTIRPDNTPVTKALDEAMRRFDEWDRAGDDPVGQNMPRFVCVFSDRTKASWNPSVSAKPAAERVQMLYFDVGIDDSVDLAITQVELPSSHEGGMRQAFTKREKIPLRVVVKATGKEIRNELIVAIGPKELRMPFVVEKDQQQTIAFEIDTDAVGLMPGQHQVEAKLATPADALSFNNQRYLTFAIRKATKVLVLADDVKNAELFAHALRSLLYAVDVRAVDDKQKLDLGEYAVVFLDGVVAPTDELWKLLADYVQTGRGLGIIPGVSLDRTAYDSEAARKLMPAAFVEKVTVADIQGAQWQIQASDLDHPFLRRYQSWLGDLAGNPRSAKRYWKVKPNDEKNVVVRYDDRSPAILERGWPKSAGKVLLLTTPMDDPKQEWNDYASKLHWFYLGLTQMCAKHLATESDNPALNFQFGGDPPRMKKPLLPAKYVLSSGDFSEEVRFDNDRWVGDHLPKAGNYTISADGEAIHQFSINIPSEESDLSRVSIGAIEAMLGEDAVVPLDRKKSLADTLKWDEPLDLFPYLMILLLFLLAFENLLANRFYRSEATDNEPRP